MMQTHYLDLCVKKCKHLPIPPGVIIYSFQKEKITDTDFIIGWFYTKNNKWYGDYFTGFIAPKEESDKETINAIIDQITETISALDKKDKENNG